MNKVPRRNRINKMSCDRLSAHQRFLDSCLLSSFDRVSPPSSWWPIISFRLFARLFRQTIAFIFIAPYIYIFFVLSILAMHGGIWFFEKYRADGESLFVTLSIALFIIAILLLIVCLYWLYVLLQFLPEKLRAIWHILCALLIPTDKTSSDAPHGFVHDGRSTVAFFSDIHITSQEHTLDGSASKTEEFFKSLRYYYSSLIDNTRCCVFLGDVVDSGQAEEWNLFDTCIERKEAFMNRSLVVPGNHDINISRNLDKTVEPYNELFREYRIGMFLNYVADMLHEDCFVIGKEDSQYVSMPARVYLQGSWSGLTTFMNEVKIESFHNLKRLTFFGFTVYRAKAEWSPPPNSVRPSIVLEKLYPLCLQIDDCLLIGLNSCNRIPSSLMTNAIGKIGRKQVRKLEHILAHSEKQGMKRIILLHHAPVVALRGDRQNRTIGEVVQAESYRGMYLKEHHKLLRLCRKYKVRGIIHGHFHNESLTIHEGIGVYACRSSTAISDSDGSIISGPTFLKV